MIKYLVVSFYRIIRKNKPDFFINLAGLTIAMTVFIFISLYVENETSFDAYHPNADRIFRLITSISSSNGQTTDMALANTTFGFILKNECPEIEDIACVDIGYDSKLEYKNKEFDHIKVRLATPSFFKLFSYPAIKGKKENFLDSPNTIILTKSLADKIFQQEDPMGKSLAIGKENYEVTGIIEDLPANTDLVFSALIPARLTGTEELADWGEYYVYLMTKTPSTTSLESKIDKLTDEKYTELLKQMEGFQLMHQLQPLKSIHFNNSLRADTPKGNMTMVYVFSIIGFLILSIAAINYVNINIVQLQKRQKEFAVRKINGCNRKWIISHILAESVLTSMMAAVLSIIMVELLMPQFNHLFVKDFGWNSIQHLLLPLFVLFLMFGLISGLYPAYKSLKADVNPVSGFNSFGKSLVVFQNIISIVMIIAVLLIGRQVRFMKNHDPGFEKQQLIAISLSDPERLPGEDVIRDEFQKLPEVRALSFGGGGTNMGQSENWMKSIMVTKDEKGNEIQFVLNQPFVDENYIDVFGIRLIKGRSFSKSMGGDRDHAAIINEAYAHTMGWRDPVGQKVFDDDSDMQVTIIGLVKDFNYEALNNPVEPLMFRILKDYPAFLFLKIEPCHLDLIKEHWVKIANDVPFIFSFIDERMNGLYAKNEREIAIFSFLSLIAILISCLGLYGLASHFILNRTKEIGIRKVNGAKINEVMLMLNKDFMKWVIIAFVLACPVAWYALQKWLQNFAYKTSLSWWIFALAGLLALIIALLTVSIQSWRAATKNPVEALRYE